jgi:hypothetical protein
MLPDVLEGDATPFDIMQPRMRSEVLTVACPAYELLSCLLVLSSCLVSDTGSWQSSVLAEADSVGPVLRPYPSSSPPKHISSPSSTPSLPFSSPFLQQVFLSTVDAKYNASLQGQATRAQYNASLKGQATRAKYAARRYAAKVAELGGAFWDLETDQELKATHWRLACSC